MHRSPLSGNGRHHNRGAWRCRHLRAGLHIFGDACRSSPSGSGGGERSPRVPPLGGSGQGGGPLATRCGTRLLRRWGVSRSEASTNEPTFFLHLFFFFWRFINKWVVRSSETPLPIATTLRRCRYPYQMRCRNDSTDPRAPRDPARGPDPPPPSPPPAMSASMCTRPVRIRRLANVGLNFTKFYINSRGLAPSTYVHAYILKKNILQCNIWPYI